MLTYADLLPRTTRCTNNFGPVQKTGVHSRAREGLIALHVGQLR